MVDSGVAQRFDLFILTCLRTVFRRATVGRIPLDEWSARRRDLYLTTHNTHNRQTNIHASGGIRTHNFSRRAPADLRLRPRGHWDRHINHNLKMKPETPPAPATYLAAQRHIIGFPYKCMALNTKKFRHLEPYSQNNINISNIFLMGYMFRCQIAIFRPKCWLQTLTSIFFPPIHYRLT